MKAVQGIPYINPNGLARPIPLERLLPDCPVGVIKTYFCSDTPELAWTLDPFGSNPLLSLEAASAGKRVLVACNNPILIFMFKMLAAPPEKQSFLAVLSEIASQLRGKERLETHLKGLYQTRCAICHASIQTSGYLWRRNESTPYAKVYQCPNCGDEGERPVTEEDLAILLPLQRGESIHRGRALNRVLHGDEVDRPVVEEALKVYNARSLYVLFSLLNKLEGMAFSSEHRLLADAMMISLLDAGTSLWTWPNLADHPRQLTLPNVYLEKNLWNELEYCIDLWSQPNSMLELTIWPKTPIKAGICLFPGPVRNLTKLPSEIKIESLICLPPRPNQAFWVLSALWSAWLWGRDANNSFNQVLGRRRFDWHWHTLALAQAFEKGASLAGQSIPVFTQIGEPGAGMTFATIAASHFAGFQLSGLAMNSAEVPIQSIWRTRYKRSSENAVNPQQIARQAIRSVLLELGEPAHYLNLYTAAVSTLAVKNCFPENIKEFTREKSTEYQGLIERLFADEKFLQRYEATSQEAESGKWGLTNWQGCQIALADRVEELLVNNLQNESPLAGNQVSQGLNQAFTGFNTPPADLVEYILNSYADWDAIHSNWTIKENELQANRQLQLHKAHQDLVELGKKLHFECAGDQPLIWKGGNQIHYLFYFSSGALLSQFVAVAQTENTQSVLVFPGGRAGLLKYKLARDPHLLELTTHGWHFLKLRTLHGIMNRSELTREIWAMQLDSDPINFNETTQLRIFG
jgi:hypothetical protein